MQLLMQCVVRHTDTAVPVQHPGSVWPAAPGKTPWGTPSEWGVPASFLLWSRTASAEGAPRPASAPLAAAAEPQMHIQVHRDAWWESSRIITHNVPLISREGFQLTIPWLSKNKALRETKKTNLMWDHERWSVIEHTSDQSTSCTLSPWLVHTLLRLRGDHTQIPSPSLMHAVANRQRNIPHINQTGFKWIQ